MSLPTKRSKFIGEPFCGFPDGFHEFDSLPEMPEDDCCIHCGSPRHEIESKGRFIINYTVDGLIAALNVERRQNIEARK